jgi:pyruvate/2-oxoglutarate dehydrogenase complex dihydrolipoamide dehydrogenase (E3) component
MTTNLEGIYAGGDVIAGPNSAILEMVTSRKAALA